MQGYRVSKEGIVEASLRQVLFVSSGLGTAVASKLEHNKTRDVIPQM